MSEGYTPTGNTTPANVVPPTGGTAISAPLYEQLHAENKRLHKHAEHYAVKMNHLAETVARMIQRDIELEGYTLEDVHYQPYTTQQQLMAFLYRAYGPDYQPPECMMACAEEVLFFLLSMMER